MSGEDGMVHLALGFGEGEVVEVMVVGVGRVMELDEGLSGEQSVMVVDREIWRFRDGAGQSLQLACNRWRFEEQSFGWFEVF